MGMSIWIFAAAWFVMWSLFFAYLIGVETRGLRLPDIDDLLMCLKLSFIYASLGGTPALSALFLIGLAAGEVRL